MRYFLALATLIASPAWAGWSLITSSADNEPVAHHYLDFETLRKDGNLRKIWQLINLPENDKDGWASLRMRVEFDCKNDTMKNMSYTVFSEHFANGKKLYTSEQSTAPKDIAPETVSWTLLKEVCKR